MHAGFEVHPIERSEEAAWAALLGSHPMARAIVPAWEELAGWVNLDYGLFDKGTLVGGFVLSVQRIPYAPLAFSRINCLMVGPERPSEALDALLTALDRIAVRRRLIETELRLRIPTVDDIPGFESHAALRATFAEHGYTPLSKVDTTYFVRVDRSDEELLASCDRSARNKIRKAQRSGATVEVSNDYTLLDDFYDAYIDMCQRKSAPVQPEALVGRGLRPLIERGHALLFTERYEAGVANMVIVDTLGVPCYVLGTRSRANVKGEVPGAAQIVQYEIMRTMRDRGAVWYDLGGCEGPVPIDRHHNFGVWRFKYGFGGRFVRFLPYLRKIRGPMAGVVQMTHMLRGDFV